MRLAHAAMVGSVVQKPRKRASLEAQSRWEAGLATISLESNPFKGCDHPVG